MDIAELMRLRIAALYTLTPDSKLESIRDLGGGVAPRFYLGRARTGHIWRFRADVPSALAAELSRLCRDEPTGDALPSQPVHAGTYRALLAAHAPIRRVWSGPCYWFEAPQRRRDRTQEIDADNDDLLCPDWTPWLARVKSRVPFVAALQHESGRDRVVSVCASVRTSTSVHEAGVETASAFRHQGHALRAVAHWAELVQRAGAAAVYSTSWDNLASQAIAAKLGAARLGADFHLT